MNNLTVNNNHKMLLTYLFVFSTLFASISSNIVISRAFSDLGKNADVLPDNYTGKCSCLNYKCGCCQRIVIDNRELKLNDTVCVNIKYLVDDIGLEMTLVINDKVYLNTTFSVKNPPPLCIAIPNMKKLASICVKFSNMSKANHAIYGCADLVFKLAYTLVEDIRLGCFRIPIGGNSSKVKSLPSNDRNVDKMTQEEKLKFLQSLGLLGKSYGDGRLNNNFVGYL